MSVEIDHIINRYLEHPEDPDAVAAVRTPEVFDVFIRRCLRYATTEGPGRSLSLLDRAHQTATSSCDMVQIQGLRSHVLNIAGSTAESFQALEIGFAVGGTCQACRASLLRYRSKVHGALRHLEQAIRDVDKCIELHQSLSDSSHDLHGNGLANAFYSRGDIRQFIGIDRRDQSLIRGAIEDFTTALELTDPAASPVLYRACLSGLAVPLYTTGDPEDLARSHGYLSQARRRMGSSTSKPSQERGKLAWVTAMVEHELIAHRRVLPREVVLGMNRRGVRPVRVRRKLEDAVSDFVKVAMPQEASACASDHAKILLHKAEPDPDYGAVRELVSGVLERIERRFELPDVAVRVAELEPLRRAVDRLVDACDPARWDVYFRVRKAIDGLRAAAGPGMITCLIRWRDV